MAEQGGKQGGTTRYLWNFRILTFFLYVSVLPLSTHWLVCYFPGIHLTFYMAVDC